MTVDRSAFVDDSGETRFAGTIQPGPGTSAGDTLQSTGVDGEAAEWAAGGGSLPVPFTAGSGVPTGSATPASVGALYVDTDEGALFVAIGVTDADWICVGGANSLANVVGVSTNSGGDINVVADSDKRVQLTGLDNADGVVYDDSADKTTIFGKAFVSTLPTADPHVAKQLWNNSGVVTVSAG